jgi:hypothetical protein
LEAGEKRPQLRYHNRIPMTASSPTRRTLRFETLTDALEEAERLVEAARDGRLTHAGNWELGQTLGHLATWADFAFEGYPRETVPPSLIRILGRLFGKRILKKGMPAGIRIRPIPGGTVGLDKMPPDEGLARLRAAFDRLATTPPKIESPFFGRLTHEQWIQLNLRHAELHLGYQVPT